MTVHKIEIFVGGARKTCLTDAEGFPDTARKIAKFYMTQRRDRFEAAIRCARKGYLLPERLGIKFDLIDDEIEFAKRIEAAFHAYAGLPEQEEKHRPFGVDQSLWL